MYSFLLISLNHKLLLQITIISAVVTQVVAVVAAGADLVVVVVVVVATVVAIVPEVLINDRTRKEQRKTKINVESFGRKIPNTRKYHPFYKCL